MKDIYYINSSGTRLNLLSDRFLLQTGTLFDHSLNYTISNVRIKNINRTLLEKELVLTIQSDTECTFGEAMDLFNECTEKDILNGTPGKLYYGESYQPCFIFGSELFDWEYDAGYVDKNVKLITAHPYWITEQHIVITPISGTEETADDSKGYPYGYPYGYANVSKSTNIKIDHYTDSDFRMIAYGPTTNVNISINGHPYHVDYPIEAGEYMVIDSRDYLPPDERIYLVRSNGERINVFNYRDPVYSVFKKIPPGNITIYYSRNYGIDLTIFKERSEPKWK